MTRFISLILFVASLFFLGSVHAADIGNTGKDGASMGLDDCCASQRAGNSLTETTRYDDPEAEAEQVDRLLRSLEGENPGYPSATGTAI